MKKESIDIYICEYCGLKHLDESWMKLHEECCPKNPKNEPCGQCVNCIINPFTEEAKCAANMDMESIGGNVLCFKYIKGTPTIE